MPIQSLSLMNYGVFRSVEFLGLSPLTIVVGANGTGKSTLFDVFSFLKDALAHDVHTAVARRGGFRELVSRGQDGPIEIVVGYSGEDGHSFVYSLSLVERDGRVVVEAEHLRSQAEDSARLMDFKRGEGTAVSGPFYDQAGKTKNVAHKLNYPSVLAVRVLGMFKDFPLIVEFRSLIERWHISNFQIASLRGVVDSAQQKHLSTTGDNLPQVLRHMRERHPEEFRKVLEAIRYHVPGVDAVEAMATEDERLLLRIKDVGFERPFFAPRVSDGTIKLLASLLLLYDPEPHPLLAVESPENHVYPRVLGYLTEDFRYYARRGGQALVSTQSYEFLSEARPDEVFWLEKAADGYCTAHRASESKLLCDLYEGGDPLSALWRQRLFEGADPGCAPRRQERP